MVVAHSRQSPAPATDAAPEPSDGRVQRGARNQEAIVEALYELVKATHLPPSVEELARKAGVGTRTVFRQFDDLDALYRSLGQRVLGEAMSLVTLAPPTGVVAKDVAALVARRARIFEHLTPFRRAARLVRHQSAFLQEQDLMTSKLFRGALLALIDPPVGADAENLVEALDAFLSFETWDRLRDHQKLSAKRAEHVLTEGALALVSAAPSKRTRRRG